MAEYTGFEVNGYDGDVSSKFDSFEYSAPRNAHDSVLKNERTYRTVIVNDTDLISNKRMINDKMAVGTDTSNRNKKRDTLQMTVCSEHLLKKAFNTQLMELK